MLLLENTHTSLYTHGCEQTVDILCINSEAIA